MTVKTCKIFECDLCKIPIESKNTPRGWRRIHIDISATLDNAVEKHVCELCVSKILTDGELQ